MMKNFEFVYLSEHDSIYEYPTDFLYYLTIRYRNKYLSRKSVNLYINHKFSSNHNSLAIIC